jgi:RNA polymerase sigma-70 factor (ECF subfamily)
VTPQSTPPGSPQFATTRWSLVVSAGNQTSENSAQALESLCRTYWFPLYAYVRKRVGDANEACDLTQAFFERLLEKNYLAEVDPQRGRFRAFLITAFKHFLSKEWEKARTQKRGGGRSILSLDFRDGDARYSAEPVSHLTSEQVYERQWVLTLLARVMQRLQDEYQAAGKQKQYEHLKSFIIGEHGDTTYANVAAIFQSTEAAMRMSAYRMRRRYRELLRQEIAETVADTADIEDEIQNLFRLAGG